MTKKNKPPNRKRYCRRRLVLPDGAGCYNAFVGRNAGRRIRFDAPVAINLKWRNGLT